MGTIRLILIISVICALFENALAQNRGSVRYGASPNDEFDGEPTRAQRPSPTRTPSVRRRRPTPTPEPTVPLVDEGQEFQSHSQEETTGRRVPSRINAPRLGPATINHPVEKPAAPLLPALADELPEAPVTTPEGKLQGRRRRPKKRRRPQGAKDVEKKDIEIPDKSKADTGSDQKSPQPYHGDSELRNSPNAYGSSSGLTDKAQWSDGNFGDSVDVAGRRDAGGQYFPPQTGTNRLPVENSEGIENSRRYSEVPQSASNPDIPNRRYVPPEPTPNRGSYVPVISPIRVPTETHEEYPGSRDEVRTRHDRPSDLHHQRRAPGNRSPSLPISTPLDVIRNSDAKPHSNQNLRNNQPNIPDRSHSEVRLPQPEQPLIPHEYDSGYNNQPGFGTSEGLLSGLREDEKHSQNENAHGVPKPTNRLPNPEDSYESVYPSYLDENVNSEQLSHTSVPHRRQENAPHTSGDVIIPYSNDIPKESTEPSKNINNVDTDKYQVSRYEPPLQRSGASSRTRIPEQDRPVEVPTRSHDSTRSRSQTESETFSRTRGSSSNKPENIIDTPTRQRGVSRYQPESSNDQQTNTRGSSRYGSDSSIDAPNKARGSTRNEPDSSINTSTRTRGSARNQPESPIDTPPRTRGLTRYQPDSSIDRPTRTRSSQADVSSQQLPRSRNTQRYQSDTEGDLSLNSRRQPTNPEDYVDSGRSHSPDQIYRQSTPERREPNEEASVPYSPYAHANPTSRPDARDATDPVRNTLRSRPQYEVREPVQPYTYEEPTADEQDPNAYVPEYQPPPRQEDRNQRIAPPPREQPVSRQQGRRENVEQRTAPRQQPAATRRQPQSQYQPPQNERSQARQPPRQQPRPRQETAAVSPNSGRSSSASKFACPDPYGFFADPRQCDKYYECRNGTAVEGLCEDGLAFNEAAAPKFLRCDSIRDVDCSSRVELQEPRPTKNCPRRYGLYPSEEDCTKFFNCVDGAATEVQCPPGLIFNDDRATCDWADLVKSSCKTEDLLGFTCPEPSAYDLQDGVYTSYPHPDNCQLHFVCIKGDDGARRPRMLACNEGLVYSPNSASCTRPDDVPGCEDFYGSRSPAPKRKPSREPLPAEPEELEETPKPRRVQNRRVRN